MEAEVGVAVISIKIVTTSTSVRGMNLAQEIPVPSSGNAHMSTGPTIKRIRSPFPWHPQFLLLDMIFQLLCLQNRQLPCSK